MDSYCLYLSAAVRSVTVDIYVKSLFEPCFSILWVMYLAVKFPGPTILLCLPCCGTTHLFSTAASLYIFLAPLNITPVSSQPHLCLHFVRLLFFKNYFSRYFLVVSHHGMDSPSLTSSEWWAYSHAVGCSVCVFCLLITPPALTLVRSPTGVAVNRQKQNCLTTSLMWNLGLAGGAAPPKCSRKDQTPHHVGADSSPGIRKALMWDFTSRGSLGWDPVS